jgi:methyl-accepting chemotaxis protein
MSYVRRSAVIQRLPVLATLIAAGAVSACGAKIPPAAPDLSAELGNRISALETAHLNLLRKFFDNKRSRVDEFVMSEWLPTFAEEAFQEEVILRIWDSVVASNDPRDRVEFIRRLGPRIQNRINNKTQELHRPLDELELTMERRLRDDYSRLKGINNSITSFLVSAAEVSEANDRFLAMFGVTEDRMNVVLDGVETAVGRLSQTTDLANKAATLSEGFKVEVDSLIGQARAIASTSGNQGG